MKPEKSRDLIPNTAKELDLDLSLTEDVLNFYYDKVRSTLNSPEDLEIKLDNLGTFQIKKGALLTYKKRYKSFIENTDPSTLSFNKYNTYTEVTKNFNIIDGLLKKIKQEKEREEEIKTNRKNVNNKDLEK